MSGMNDEAIRDAEARPLEQQVRGCPRCRAPADTPHEPGCDFAGGMREGTTPRDYHDAPYGIGPVAAAWRDKPHRVLFDLKDEIIKLRAEVADRDRVIGDLMARNRRLRLANAQMLGTLEGLERGLREGGLLTPEHIRQVATRFKARHPDELATLGVVPPEPAPMDAEDIVEVVEDFLDDTEPLPED